MYDVDMTTGYHVAGNIKKVKMRLTVLARQ
jgi:hypothetical protein